MKFRQEIRKSRVIQILSSLRVTVACIVLLFILTLWGTIAQVHMGLYQAQERYFYSHFFLALGFLPFPGAHLVMWVMFVNIIGALLVKFSFQWKNIGLLVIHLGILLFLISGFVTFKTSVDSHLTLKEGQASNTSAAFYQWEIAIWENSRESQDLKTTRNVTAIDIKDLKLEHDFVVDHLNFKIKLTKYLKNSAAYRTGGSGQDGFLNASNIQKLEPLSLENEPEKNTPGVLIQILTENEEVQNILLYGGEQEATKFKVGEKQYNIILRFKRYRMPFLIKLVDFTMEKHPGTDTARSFKSLVAVESNGVWREKLISMNNPLRYKDYTFYQASYSIDKNGKEISTLAVVKNAGRILPYTATFITVVGLMMHFLMSAFRRKANKNKVQKNVSS